jgi:predicted enzyme related to lactoylglutathione lyase
MHVVTVLDCHDLGRVAEFWAAALGYRIEGEPVGRYLSLVPHTGDGPDLLLQRVPEPKAGKNRMHLDLRVADVDSEVDRLVALGARRQTAEPIEEAGWSWHVLTDPDGNEFCVLRPPT